MLEANTKCQGGVLDARFADASKLEGRPPQYGSGAFCDRKWKRLCAGEACSYPREKVLAGGPNVVKVGEIR